MPSSSPSVATTHYIPLTPLCHSRHFAAVVARSSTISDPKLTLQVENSGLGENEQDNTCCIWKTCRSTPSCSEMLRPQRPFVLKLIMEDSPPFAEEHSHHPMLWVDPALLSQSLAVTPMDWSQSPQVHGSPHNCESNNRAVAAQRSLLPILLATFHALIIDRSMLLTILRVCSLF